MANNRLFVVKFRIGHDDDFSISKAFASKLSAQQYIESECKRRMQDNYNPDNGCWIDAWNYRYENAQQQEDYEGKEHLYDYLFEIEEVDVEQNIVLPELPFLEKESIKLKELESNLQTKIQEKSELIAHLKQMIKERVDSENQGGIWSEKAFKIICGSVFCCLNLYFLKNL